jgi:hypothetical protein
MPEDILTHLNTKHCAKHIHLASCPCPYVVLCYPGTPPLPHLRPLFTYKTKLILDYTSMNLNIIVTDSKYNKATSYFRNHITYTELPLEPSLRTFMFGHFRQNV